VFSASHKQSDRTIPERYFSESVLSTRTLRLARLEAAVQINMAEKQINTAS
jgi:hypothetical protein